jgi:hypothetical protein
LKTNIPFKPTETLDVASPNSIVKLRDKCVKGDAKGGEDARLSATILGNQDGHRPELDVEGVKAAEVLERNSGNLHRAPVAYHTRAPSLPPDSVPFRPALA